MGVTEDRNWDQWMKNHHIKITNSDVKSAKKRGEPDERNGSSDGTE